MSLRADVIRRGIDPQSLALEVGPLDRPVLTKPEFDVRYLDFADTETLRTKYADDPAVGEVVDVDITWDGSSPLRDFVGDLLFDAVVASHVIEHVPDPIGWLQRFSAVLRPGGLVNLVIPDKRVTFDVNRRLTEVADLIDGYVRRASQPSFAQIYDFHTKAVMPADAAALWAGEVDYSNTVRPGDLAREALTACLNMTPDSPYVDVHCSVFTPQSFVEIMSTLAELELIDLKVTELVPTPPNTVEFYVRLERLSPELTPAERSTQLREGLAQARAAVAAAPAPLPYRHPESDKESDEQRLPAPADANKPSFADEPGSVSGPSSANGSAPVSEPGSANGSAAADGSAATDGSDSAQTSTAFPLSDREQGLIRLKRRLMTRARRVTRQLPH